MRLKLSYGKEINNVPLYIDEDFAVGFYKYLVGEQNREFYANGKSDYFFDLEDLIFETVYAFPGIESVA